MELINEYFKDLVFTKVVEDKEGYSIYGAGIHSNMGGDKMRYVLAFVPVIYAKKRQSHLKDLMWKNLQTRTLTNSYKLKQQSWKIPREVPDFLFSIVDRKKEYSRYECEEIPFEILLLHNPKKKSEYQYRNKLMLSAAIDIFETLINYKEPSVNYPFVNPESQEHILRLQQHDDPSRVVDSSFELL
jgi:hypothetical protein